METNAITLVYLRESSLRRKERGITTSLNMSPKSATESTKLSIALRILYSHEGRYPKLSINQEWNISSSFIESPNYARHEIANYNQVTDTNAKALDGNRSIKDYGCIGVCDL
jgi:hypothetical protein